MGQRVLTGVQGCRTRSGTVLPGQGERTAAAGFQTARGLVRVLPIRGPAIGDGGACRPLAQRGGGRAAQRETIRNGGRGGGQTGCAAVAGTGQGSDGLQPPSSVRQADQQLPLLPLSSLKHPCPAV